MILKETLSLQAIVKKFILWCSGVNDSLLSQIKSEQQKYNVLGLTVLASSILGLISMMLMGSLISDKIYLVVAFSILWGLMIFFINKSFILTFRANLRIRKTILLIVRFLLSLAFTFSISFSIQLTLFSQAINEKLLLNGKILNNGLLAKMNALQDLKNENLNIALFYWIVIILIFLVDFSPMILLWMTSGDAYETSLKMAEERELRIMELYAEQRYGKIKDKLTKDIQKREDLAEIPFGGFEFYIDYKSLRLHDINKLFSTINDIYGSVYRIENYNETSNSISKDLYYDLENLFKSHPEDVLLIHSIETGNSITFKISTGWRPKIELVKGDFTIFLPKGSIALLLTGYLITKVFDYGISNYKQLLEIEKLKKENIIMDNQLLKEQVSIFNSKLEASPNELKAEFQLQLFKFYEITLDNSNFIKTNITSDKSIVEKINRGEVSIIKEIK